MKHFCVKDIGKVMRTILYKSRAVQAVIAILALTAILTVWPVRIWHTTWQTSGGGTIVSESGTIDSTHDMVQKFIAQYDRIDSVSVYVTEVSAGRYMEMSLYDEKMQPVYDTFVDMGVQKIPGYIRIPMQVGLHVNEQYTMLITPVNASFKVAYEDIPVQASPYLQETAYQDTAVSGYHLAATYAYSLPLDKMASLTVIAAILAIALVLVVLTEQYYGRQKEKNHLITVARTLQYTLNPICAIALGTLMVMVFPLKLFDNRLTDIIFYELGLILTAVLVFYGINHRRYDSFDSIFCKAKDTFTAFKSFGQMIAIALTIMFGCEYMNALYDIYHTIAERKMVICILVLIILTFSRQELLNIVNLVYLIAAGAFGVYYDKCSRLAITEKEYNLHNAALAEAIVIAVLSGILLINLIRMLLIRIRDVQNIEKRNLHAKREHISAFGVLTVIFFAVMVIMRNTRWWGVVLVLVYSLFYFRFHVWKEKDLWTDILSGGLILNFLGSWIFCLLYRYFAGFVSARFSFVFHTVTVTAEYLTFMECTAVVLLLAKLYKVDRNWGIRRLAAAIWKEFILFGIITAYVIFTMSRTAYMAVGFACLIMLLIVARGRGEAKIRSVFRNIMICVVSAILCFPAVFTLQRVVPAIIGRPYIFTIEDTVTDLRGGADWGDRSFMCVERFESMFMEKILGMQGDSYHYPRDQYNYDNNGKLMYGPDGELLQQDSMGNAGDTGHPLYAAAVLTEDEQIQLMNIPGLMQTVENAGDSKENAVSGLDTFSNGRFTIFGAYLSQMNLTGHDEMGALLPDGETAVHAHNTYLQVAYDHGIPAGILFAILIISAFAAGFIYDRKQTDRISALPMAITLGFAIAGLTEWVFQFSNPMTVALMLSWAPLICTNQTKRLS